MTAATIFTEQARVLVHQALPAAQYLIRLQAPHCAQTVKPGNFIHLSCGHERFK